MYVLREIIKKVKIFPMKFTILASAKKFCTIYRQVLVMYISHFDFKVMFVTSCFDNIVNFLVKSVIADEEKTLLFLTIFLAYMVVLTKRLFK